jgi:hypothetical protein
MTAIDRRSVLRAIPYLAVVATVGMALNPEAAESMPSMASDVSANTGSLIEKARVVVVDPRRRPPRRPRRRRFAGGTEDVASALGARSR